MRKKRRLSAKQLSSVLSKAGRKGGKVKTLKGFSMASVEKRTQEAKRGAAARWRGQE